MRQLTPEEIASLRRRHLLPWRIAMGGGAVLAAAVFLPPAIKGAAKGNWGDAWYLVIFVVGFFGAFYMASKPIRDDLTSGMAETVTGEVERCRFGRGSSLSIRLAGNDYQVVHGAYRPAQGERVTVEFLPRSRLAIKVERGA